MEVLNILLMKKVLNKIHLFHKILCSHLRGDNIDETNYISLF